MGRIINYNEVSSVGSDDYLLLDSSSGGTKKIKASNIAPVDPTFTRPGQAADAVITGKTLEGIYRNNFDYINDVADEFSFYLEYGYINVPSGVITFTDVTTAMRTPKNYPMHIRQGDVITLNNSNYRYQMIYQRDSDWATTGWKTGNFVPDADRNVYIVIGKTDGSVITDVAELSSALTITRALNKSYKDNVSTKGVFRNIPVKKNQIQYKLECGYIRVGSGAVSFEDSKTAFRTPEAEKITLPPKATISVNEGYQYQFIYINESTGLWTGTGWKSVDWQMPASVFRTGYIVVAKSNNSVIGDDEGIFDAVTITETVHKADFEYRDFYDSSHRGYQYIAPESTKASFSLAKKFGYNTVECDIRLTSDGEMVIHHNDGMPSNSNYKIADHTLAELRENANMGTYNGVTQQILTIDDLLTLCKTLDLNIFIELKATLTDAQKTALSQKIKAAGMSRKAFIISTVNDATYIYRENDEYIGLLLNYANYDNFIGGLVNNKGITAIYNQSRNISDETIQTCHNNGVLAIGWCVTYTPFGYTEETAKAEILRAINAGIDGMTIDQWTCANLVSENYSI